MNNKYPDIKVGDKFDRLTVLRFAGGVDKKWTCLCICGNEKDILDRALKPGHTRSCGCLHDERTVRMGKSKKTHGHSPSPNGKQKLTPEYAAWRAMRRRCYKPNTKGFKDYGARGITVDYRWLECFENFYADMGPKPSPEYTIERRDNDGNYEPSNCYWATKLEQAHNKRNNIFLIIDGVRKCIAEWAQDSGLKAGTLQRRVKYGWPMDKILQPARKLTRRVNAICN